MRKGTWVTILMWAVTIAVRLYVDTLWKGSNQTALLYMGISLLTQQYVVLNRAKSLQVQSEVLGLGICKNI